MPVYQINPQYITIDPDPSKLADFMNLVNDPSNPVGHFESYVEDYDKVRELLHDKYGEDRPVGGFVDHLATVTNVAGEEVAKMIVVAAFEDKAGNPRFLANGDWIVGKCPPNDRPQRAPGAPAPSAEVLASVADALAHLQLNN